ncbi:helix-turn-helix domain-containing protein (plasmid) [Arthrobacter sp. UC242_113]|uniref:helix-turn-helix domain-containing protein n=1 Tax=Arthrobacter sp. UC242_113 TaxID=3374550 RepID=UPI0037572236
MSTALHLKWRQNEDNVKTEEAVRESRDGPLASSATELGQAMRKMRKSRGWTLRDMEALQEHACTHIASKSLLSKFETGKKLPDEATSEKLDQLYGGESWIHMSVVALRQRTWSPWDADWPATEHFHSWAEEYRGPVWIRVKPTPQDAGTEYSIQLSWGPHRWTRKVACPVEGLYLITGKGDGEVPIRVVTSPRSFCQFGTGEIDGDGTVMDIKEEWS